MTDRKGLNDEAENSPTQDRTDAETARPQPHGCKPWCTNHDSNTGVCIGDNVEVDGDTVGISYSPDEGVQVHLDRFDRTLPLEMGVAYGRAIIAQAEKANTKTEFTFDDLPDAWIKAAETKGRDRAVEVKSAYVSELYAYAHEKASGTPALWLETDPCPAWCDSRLHKTSDHPDDRGHDGATSVHRLLSMPVIPMRFADGTRWAAPELHLQLVKEYRDVEPRVFINDSEDQVRLHATLDELEEIANAMLDLVRQGRGA
ncbi:DUF6907 domain-containing protein [Nonomuraea wenchangensis]|uniref:DUF6907 domain-containing protein n=1 Tax=Nonomuraea wenchangensis TaxID=568860 RepID=UPI0033171AC5